MKESSPNPVSLAIGLFAINRLVWAWLYRVWPRCVEAMVLVEPAIVVQWHRQGFRLYWRCRFYPQRVRWREANFHRAPAEKITVRQLMRGILGIVACVGLGGIASLVTCADAASRTATTPAAPTEQSAEAFLHSIYDRYLGPQDKARPIDYSKPRELREYFEPSLAGIMHDDFVRAKKADDVPTLDADPFIDAQDWEIKAFDIQVTSVDGDHAKAVVKFDNAGEHKVLHLQLVRVAGNWRIHDIDYGGGEGTLRGLYKAGGSK